jgi:hypothetical protein
MTHPIAAHGHIHRLAHAILTESASDTTSADAVEALLPAITELDREELTWLVFSIAGLATTWIMRCRSLGVDTDQLQQDIGLLIAQATDP